MYTLGQPRIGNRAFTHHLEEMTPNIFRMTHRKDIVAHIPPCKLFTPEPLEVRAHGEVALFRCDDDAMIGATPYHFAREIFFVDDWLAPQLCDPLDGEDSTCSNQYLTYSVDDHLTYFGGRVGDQCGHPVPPEGIIDPTVRESSFLLE